MFLEPFAFRTNGLTYLSFMYYADGMKPGVFLSVFAPLARVDQKSLVVFDRQLKAAHILPVFGRGPSARDVDAGYLARLLIARMATDRPARAAEAFHRCSIMQMNPDQHHWVASLLPDPDHSLLDLFELLCSPEHNLSAGPEFEVRFVGQVGVEVRFSPSGSESIDLHYMARSDLEGELPGDPWNAPGSMWGIVDGRQFNSHWLHALKTVVFDQGGGRHDGRN